MRKATQTKADSRPLTENFSPKAKVKDILLQQPPQPPSTSVLQEIPMKPSQIPNWQSYTSSRQDKNNCSPSSYTRRNHETKSAVTLSSSGSRNATEQRQNSKCSDVGGVTMVQLHRPEVLPLNTWSAQEVLPVHRSDSWSSSRSAASVSSPPLDRSRGSAVPGVHSAVVCDQNRQREHTASKEKPLPVKHSSKRRHSEPDDNTRKRRLQAVHSNSALKGPAGPEPPPVLGPRPSARPSAAPATTQSNLRSEPTSDKSGHLKLSRPLKRTSPVPRPSLTTLPSPGAKKDGVKPVKNSTVTLASPSKARNDHSVKTDGGRSLFSWKVRHKRPVDSDHHNTGRSPVGPVTDLSTVPRVGGGKKPGLNVPKPSQKQSSGSSSSRDRAVVPEDVDQMFTADAVTHAVNDAQKTLKKTRTDAPTRHTHTHTAENRGPCDVVTASASPGAKTPSPTGTASPHATQTKASSGEHMHVSMPTVALVRVDLQHVPLLSKHSAHHRPGASPEKPVITASSHHHHKNKCETTGKVAERTAHEDAASPPPRSPSAQTAARDAKSITDEDSLDLGLGPNLDLGVADTRSSGSSEDEQLVSLKEMMAPVSKPPNPAEQGASSEPGPPGPTSHRNNKPSVSKTNTNIYKNNLDQMMKEIRNHKKAKEVETQLLTACKDLLTIAENEEAKESRDEAMFAEQQQFLQRYSLVSSAIRDVPPGEVVFDLEKFGRIFNPDSLQLRHLTLSPQEMTQKSLLWSSHAQLRLHINIGLFQEAYSCHSPCPSQVTRFLFKMMSVHSERVLCEKMLQALCDIAYSAAAQIVENGSQQFEVWVPSLADVTLVLMNMGVPFVTLFPFENLQPLFTEGDLLEDVCIKSEGSSGQKERSVFPEHNCNNIFKYLCYSMSLCPRAYSDYELLLLLTLLGRISLETRLLYQYSVEMYPLQYKIVNNIRDWDAMMCSICLAFTDLTDDHHNMCLLVQTLPDSMRGRQLRHHLSLCMISKLLDGNCTYTPKKLEFELADLRLYLPRMQPSAVLRGLVNSSSRTRDEDTASLDQQAYYLCHSLLTLANEASNLQMLPPHQKEQLLHLCSELATHIKCDIRESKKCLYRTKVKDLVARIDTKWQMLLLKSRPLNGKLCDYWQPRTSRGADESLASEDEDGEEAKAEGGRTRHPATQQGSEVAADDAAGAQAGIQTFNHQRTDMAVCSGAEASHERSQADGGGP